eukprot:m.289495 g.289495  ORF g.289495 m.289495 type:complete len:136 (+) comp40715_c2_seq20:2803-3210(+)
MCDRSTTTMSLMKCKTKHSSKTLFGNSNSNSSPGFEVESNANQGHFTIAIFLLHIAGLQDICISSLLNLLQCLFGTCSTTHLQLNDKDRCRRSYQQIQPAYQTNHLSIKLNCSGKAFQRRTQHCMIVTFGRTNVC